MNRCVRHVDTTSCIACVMWRPDVHGCCNRRHCGAVTIRRSTPEQQRSANCGNGRGGNSINRRRRTSSWRRQRGLWIQLSAATVERRRQTDRQTARQAERDAFNYKTNRTADSTNEHFWFKCSWSDCTKGRLATELFPSLIDSVLVLLRGTSPIRGAVARCSEIQHKKCKWSYRNIYFVAGTSTPNWN